MRYAIASHTPASQASSPAYRVHLRTDHPLVALDFAERLQASLGEPIIFDEEREQFIDLERLTSDLAEVQQAPHAY